MDNLSETAPSRTLLDLLQAANRHVAECDHRITRQRHLIAKLRAKRQATSTAEWFLDYLRASRVVHLVARERLQLELATSSEIPQTAKETKRPGSAAAPKRE